MSIEPTCDFCGTSDKFRCRSLADAQGCSSFVPEPVDTLIAKAMDRRVQAGKSLIGEGLTLGALAKGAATAPIPPRQSFTDAPKAPALETQIGGSHYKDMKIQPITYSMVNGLDACQHTIIKYVSRFRDKNGIEDLEKAKHCIDLLIEFERERLAE